MCRKTISTGEQLYVVDENKFMCERDFNKNHECCPTKQGKRIWFGASFFLFSSSFTQFYKSGLVGLDVDCWSRLGLELGYICLLSISGREQRRFPLSPRSG